MLFEDAHWIDPTSPELLDLTFARCRAYPCCWSSPSARVSARLGRPGSETMLLLNRLGGQDGAALVDRLAGKTGLSRDRR
jgi:predicted ATPase